MTYHAQLNLIMLATIIGLAIFLYLTPQFQSGTDEEYQISIRTPDTVQTIRVIRHGKEAVLQRVAGGWYVQEPFVARADEELVSNMLNVLSANSRQRFPLADTENFSLDKPHIELYLDDDYFAFGGLAPTTSEQYLAINHHVYLVSPRYAVWIPVDPIDVVSTTLLATDEIPVKLEMNGLSVQQQNSQWRVVTGQADGLTPDLLAHWMQKWRHSQAEALMTDLQHPATVLVSVNITLHDGQTISLKAVEEKNGIIFFRDNEQVGYYFSEASSRQLLNPYAFE